MDRTLWPAIALLLGCFGFFEITGADLWVQDHFYNFHTGTWLIASEAPLPRLLFYTAPKVLIWLLGGGLLTIACLPDRWRARMPWLQLPRRATWVAVATLATAPLLVATTKATTHVHTPRQILRYGGVAPYVKPFQAVDASPNGSHIPHGRGFPAGHASGGFALFGLAGLAGTARGRRRLVVLGLVAGSVMGAYQMLNGNHYLSHTLITAMLCWIVFLGYRRLFHLAGHAAACEIAATATWSHP